MPMYKRCGRCGARLTSGSTCSCLKARHAEYNRARTDSQEVEFYSSGEWKEVRTHTAIRFCGIDIYSFYIGGIIEVGQTAHHIVPLKDDWSLRIQKDNLIYLSESNHKAFHKKMEQGDREKKDVIDLLSSLVERYSREFEQ